MSAIVDRLRAVVKGTEMGSGLISTPASEGNPSPSFLGNESRPHFDSVSELLDGVWCESDGHRFLAIDRAYRPGHRHGRLALLDQAPTERSDSWRVLLATSDIPSDESGRSRALFIDLETTGLAGGAGTCAFLVGCGWFDGYTFRIRQFLLTSHRAERWLLESLTELASGSQLLVSYNGKTFDVPLIETRFLFNRMSTPFAERPHLDMLHLARRLWRAERAESPDSAAGCRLVEMEQSVCGHVREDDVPGFEIPSRYFHFLRTGDPRPLQAVIEHNRLDLLSLACLTARAVTLIEGGPASARTAREAVGLGRLFERTGMIDPARAAYARAAGLDGVEDLIGDTETRADALRACALLARRARDHAEAASAWRALVSMPDCPTPILREAREALAVHHEHRLRDPRGARAQAIECLPLLRTPARRKALEHRLARLERKLPVADTIALF